DSAAPWRLFRPWRLQDGLDRLDAAWAYEGGITIAGTSFPVKNLSAAAFPGTYLVVPGTSVLVEAPSVSVPVGGPGLAQVNFSPTIKKATQDDVQAQVAASIDRCGKSPPLQPANCPFSTQSSRPNPTNVAWTI